MAAGRDGYVERADVERADVLFARVYFRLRLDSAAAVALWWFCDKPPLAA
jgi:hypothetical protein